MNRRKRILVAVFAISLTLPSSGYNWQLHAISSEMQDISSEMQDISSEIHRSNQIERERLELLRQVEEGRLHLERQKLELQRESEENRKREEQRRFMAEMTEKATSELANLPPLDFRTIVCATQSHISMKTAACYLRNPKLFRYFMNPPTISISDVREKENAMREQHRFSPDYVSMRNRTLSALRRCPDRQSGMELIYKMAESSNETWKQGAIIAAQQIWLREIEDTVKSGQ